MALELLHHVQLLTSLSAITRGVKDSITHLKALQARLNFHRIRGNYVPAPSPELPLLRKRYTPISGIAYNWQLPKTHPFRGFLGKYSRDYAPKYPFPENMGTRMWPLCAFEWGGGGGGALSLYEISSAYNFSNTRRILGKPQGVACVLTFSWGTWVMCTFWTLFCLGKIFLRRPGKRGCFG